MNILGLGQFQWLQKLRPKCQAKSSMYKEECMIYENNTVCQIKVIVLLAPISARDVYL